MKSIPQQLLDLIEQGLKAANLGQGGVFRSRQLALAVDETPSLVLYPLDEESERFSDTLDKTQFAFAIEIMVRGDPYDVIADPIALAVHQVVMSTPLLRKSLLARRKSVGYEGHDADQSVGFVVLRYEAIYLASASNPVEII